MLNVCWAEPKTCYPFSKTKRKAPQIKPNTKSVILITHSTVVEHLGRTLQHLEDEMVGWHHQLNAHESEQAWAAGDGRGSLAENTSFNVLAIGVADILFPVLKLPSS